MTCLLLRCLFWSLLHAGDPAGAHFLTTLQVDTDSENDTRPTPTQVVTPQRKSFVDKVKSSVKKRAFHNNKKKVGAKNVGAKKMGAKKVTEKKVGAKDVGATNIDAKKVTKNKVGAKDRTFHKNKSNEERKL